MQLAAAYPANAIDTVRDQCGPFTIVDLGSAVARVGRVALDAQCALRNESSHPSLVANITQMLSICDKSALLTHNPSPHTHTHMESSTCSRADRTTLRSVQTLKSLRPLLSRLLVRSPASTNRSHRQLAHASQTRCNQRARSARPSMTPWDMRNDRSIARRSGVACRHDRCCLAHSASAITRGHYLGLMT